MVGRHVRNGSRVGCRCGRHMDTQIRRCGLHVEDGRLEGGSHVELEPAVQVEVGAEYRGIKRRRAFLLVRLQLRVCPGEEPVIFAIRGMLTVFTAQMFRTQAIGGEAAGCLAWRRVICTSRLGGPCSLGIGRGRDF